MKIEAVGYCRVSSQGQRNAGSGLDRQAETIRVFAEQAGYELVKVYHEAFTGTETERPIFETMLTELLDNGCRVIIIECLDRLARDLAIQLQIIALLANKEISLLNAMTGQNITHPSDPMTKAMIQIQGTFAELDKNLLVRKLRKGRQAKRERNGRCEGRKPFGYCPGEPETLKRIKQLRRKRKGENRLGPYQIAQILNSEQLPTRFGRPWTGAAVKKIITRF